VGVKELRVKKQRHCNKVVDGSCKKTGACVKLCCEEEEEEEAYKLIP